MKGLRKVLAILVAAAMLLTLVPTAALAALEDTVTGTFAVNAPPSITTVTLWDTSPTEVTAMTPQVEFDVRVKVTNVDGLTDLDTIVVAIWYDSDGGVPTLGEFDTIVAGSGDAQTSIFITWTEGATFVLTEETGSTWALGTGVVGTADSSTAFQFKFTVGKVATETAVGLWQIAAKVTDDSAETDWDYDTTPGSSMAWYGEVTVLPASVDFGNLVAGTDFGASTIQSVSSVIYIANGAYDEKVKSNSTWGGSSALAEDGVTDVAEEFALKADDTATLASAVVVDTTGVTIDDTGVQTVEAGADVTTNNLWLKLASTFTAGSYSSGIISYIIADGT